MKGNYDIISELNYNPKWNIMKILYFHGVIKILELI